MRKRQKLIIALLSIILYIILISIFIKAAIIPCTTLNKSETDVADYTSVGIEAKPVCTPIPTTSTNEEQFAVVSEEIISRFKQPEYKSNLSTEEINIEICNLRLYRSALNNMYLNYQEKFSTEINELVSSEIDAVNNLLEKYYEDLEYARLWRQRAQEYPAATQIWLSMKEQGWNDYVCAGILGNIMAECGGHTLNIQWNIYDYSGWFYGICQWSLYYIPEASGLSLENQLSLLYNTIEAEFDYAGFCYYYGFTYDDFLQMTDYRNAALAFAKVYERCGSASHSIRQYNAQIAYEYFAGQFINCAHNFIIILGDRFSKISIKY